MSDKSEGLDALTNIWTAETAVRLIEHYLDQSGEPGGDALFLLELAGFEEYRKRMGEEKAQDALRGTAHFFRRILKRTDLAARVGENIFLVYILGCRSHRQAIRMAQMLGRRFAEQCESWGKDAAEAAGAGDRGLRLITGIVLCQGQIKTCEALLQSAKAALCRARQEPAKIVVMTDRETPGTEGDWEIPAIPESEMPGGRADMEFVGRMMELFMNGIRRKEEIESGLAQIGGYFGGSQVYLVMKSNDNRNYETAYEWQRERQRVRCDNLKTIAGLLGDRYGRLFDSRGLLVCSGLEDLELLDPVMAERQRLQGAGAMLQYAVRQAGDFMGYLCLADDRKERMWSRSEIATFSMVGKAVAAGIIQIRFQSMLGMLMSHDLLTEAWNYNHFLREGGKCLNQSTLRQAVLSLDIKNFKSINQSYGYETGNQVLVELSGLLHYFTGDDEKYARIEADKFALLLEYQTVNGLKHRLEQLIRRIEQIPADRSRGFSVSCIIGVCLVRPEDCDAAVLVDHANLARKSLKNYHKSAYAFYNEETDRKLKREQELASRMRAALQNGEFIVYYQPKISLADKRCIGMEALVRWRMEDGTLVPPDDFIPLFEKNGFITELDLYVFRRVCRLLAGWKAEGRTVLPVAVNVSRIHIREVHFLDTLVAICREYGVETEHLELEITESAFLHDTGVILQVAGQIKERGFVLSMDDFGTGYSSLSLLKDLPVDIIKLDREFFRKEMSGREQIIVSNVIHMAKALDIQVVSEGIETRENEQFLEEIGCEYAQGYRYGRPAPIEELLPMLDGGPRGEMR